MDRFLVRRPRVVQEDQQPNVDANANPVMEAEESQTPSEEEDGDIVIEDEGELGGDAAISEDDINNNTAAAGVDNLDVDISQQPNEGPRRPILKSYQAEMFGNQRRSFNKHWYDDYVWLEYSVTRDAAFCFACRHFLRPGQHGFHSEPAFTINGFRNWRKATGKFKGHNESGGHKFSMEAWCEFRTKQDSGSKISNMLDVGHSKLVQENRRYMKAVVESLRYTACQGIAQRGHAEDEESTNRGNFIELLHLISMFDSTVAKKIASNPSNAKYTHHDIQNEIFSVMANMLRKEISDEVKEAEYFALMVDESKDVSKKEQISIVVRYLNGGTVHEEFLHFAVADGLVADSLLNSIKSTLSLCNIDVNACIGQCYDGAAVMSGCHSGVQQRFREEVPQALYIHCHAHRLNLVLVDCVHNVKTAAEFFETVQMLYNFFSGSVVHDLFLKKQKELEPKAQRVELKRLSDTRWSCQYSALCAIQKTLPSIRATLQDIISQPNPRRNAEARALSAIIDETFVLHLTLFADLFKLTKFMSDHLQSPNLDLASAGDLAQSVISAISAKRTEVAWENIRVRAKELSLKAGITQPIGAEPEGPPDPPPRQKRQTHPPRHLDAFIVEAPIERSDNMDDMQHSFYPVIE